MDKDNLLFCKQWRDAIAPSPPEVRLEVYEAIMAYGFDGVVPGNLSPMAQMAFMFIKPQVDRIEENYRMICERNRENGKKGGRPKQPKETQENPKNPLGYLGFGNNPKQPKETQENPLYIDKDIDKNIVEEEKEKKKNFPPPPIQRMVRIQDIESFLEGLKGKEQMNTVMMMISRVIGKVPDDDEMKTYFSLFVNELKIQGVSEKLENDICQHFVSWARIALPKELKLNKNKKDKKDEYEFYKVPDGFKPLV